MNGPAGHKEKEEPSDDSMSEDEFIAKLLRESIGEEEDEDMPPAADDVVETEDAEEEPEDSEDENFDFDEDEEEEESPESCRGRRRGIYQAAVHRYFRNNEECSDYSKPA